MVVRWSRSLPSDPSSVAIIKDAAVGRHEDRRAEVSAPCGPQAQAFQQALSRKQEGSANRKKAVVKVARVHGRVAATRRDWQHKLSTAIICEPSGVRRGSVRRRSRLDG
ncbi:hypothetical protein GCM10010109_18180 [Actinoplanes campanulatus]|nr:hypothetical protein GCM10010109_18180 [Actinoplanes campanulatus]GID36336.1 hypothetical protein Aca09nite_28420 [Actinoplanes campanulatus]